MKTEIYPFLVCPQFTLINTKRIISAEWRPFIVYDHLSSIFASCFLKNKKAIIEIEKDIPEKNFLFLPSDIFHSISIWWLYVFCYYANKVVKCWDIQNNNVHHWQNMIKFGMKNVTEELLIISKRNSKQSMQKMFSTERRAWGWAAP